MKKLLLVIFMIVFPMQSYAADKTTEFLELAIDTQEKIFPIAKKIRDRTFKPNFKGEITINKNLPDNEVAIDMAKQIGDLSLFYTVSMSADNALCSSANMCLLIFLSTGRADSYSAAKNVFFTHFDKFSNMNPIIRDFEMLTKSTNIDISKAAAVSLKDFKQGIGYLDTFKKYLENN